MVSPRARQPTHTNLGRSQGRRLDRLIIRNRQQHHASPRPRLRRCHAPLGLSNSHLPHRVQHSSPEPIRPKRMETRQIPSNTTNPLPAPIRYRRIRRLLLSRIHLHGRGILPTTILPSRPRRHPNHVRGLSPSLRHCLHILRSFHGPFHPENGPIYPPDVARPWPLNPRSGTPHQPRSNS